MNPTHMELRRRTADAHDRVDAVFAAYDLSRRAGYAAMLRAHLDALLPHEAALTRAQGSTPLLDDWPARRRLPALLADLDDLAARPGTQPAIDASHAPSEPQAAGILYVLEGSRLGSRFLARQLPADFPRRYLDADQAPGNWPKLLEKLDAILYQRDALDIAVVAALEVFDAFEATGRSWLAKV